ncbi:MAG TPA: DUF167 domain-containing protein [Methanospirillum sp.]|uniref:DUF167 domain-containing protein n=1 Tax=Methanospirillum sp. TaxID=45200 RepID=UPI002D1518D2|nr:DUF167 domain-containing protein [Methanospirillum sp.]HWQ64991.1 DUF167 domain-containing protein [Methanospirillum sp.]
MTTPDEIRSSLVATDDGTIFTIEVSANSRVERFPTGYNTWRQALGIQVKAPAVEGKANKAITGLIAETLNIPKTSVHIISGQTSSVKRIKIDGVSDADLSQRLSALILAVS